MSTVSRPDHLLTLAEWDELPEDVCRRSELVEGVMQMSPAASVSHQIVLMRLLGQLNALLAASGHLAIPDVDVVLVDSFPPTQRKPDVVVTDRSVLDRRLTRLTAADVLLAVEILSPGSRRIDRIAKLVDYAETGIEHYWIIDIDESPVTLDTFRLADGAYRPQLTAATGVVDVDDPQPLTIDLPALLT